jgi:hypothetical protein
MASTPQTQAVQVANGLIGAAQQFMSIYAQLVTLQQQWTDNAVATTLSLMATAALNSDGSLGAADGSPNVAHPMTNVGLSRAISSTQVTQIKTILDGFVTYINGSAVTTQASARPILNVAVGG